MFRQAINNERDFLELVRTAAELSGWELFYHTHLSKRSDSGWPDVVICRTEPRPRIIIAELKFDRPKRRAKATASQLEWLEALAKQPHIESFLWHYPRDVDAIFATLGLEAVDAVSGLSANGQSA